MPFSHSALLRVDGGPDGNVLIATCSDSAGAEESHSYLLTGTEQPFNLLGGDELSWRRDAEGG